MTAARRALALAALAAVAGGCASGRYQVKGRPVSYEGFYASFPSGMRLVVYEMPHVDRFMLAVSYRAGAVDDPPGKEGLAHLAEHLAFRVRPGGKGTPRIWDQLTASGWFWNAVTTADATDYWEVGKPADLRAALELEAARMRDPLAGVTEDDLAVEREVVISEWRERFDTDPTGSELQWVFEAVLPGHPYARPTVGTPDSLRRITLQDVRALMGARYTAQGAILALIAPRKAREAVAEVVEAFGPLIGEGVTSVEPLEYQPPALPEKPVVPEALQRRKAPVDYPRLWVAWPVPGYYARGVPQTLAVDAALYSSVVTRLARWWNQGVVHGVDTGVLFRDGVALLYVQVELDRAEDAERVAGAVRFAAEKLRLAYMSRGQDWLRDQLLVRAYRDLEQIYAPAVSRFVRAYRMPDYLRGWSAMVALQLQHKLDAYADEFLSSSRSAAILVEPDRNATALSSGGGPARAEDPAVTEDDLAGLEPPPRDRVRSVARAPGLDRAERRTLPNGLEVVVARRGTLPVAEVRLVFRTDADGTPSSPVGLGRLAMIASDSERSGFRQMALGAERSQARRPESVVVRVQGSSGTLEGLLESASLWWRDMGTGYTDLALEALTHRLEWDARRPSRRAYQALLGSLFPDHAYGHALTAEKVGRYGFVVAGAWLERQIRPERATLIVASDVAPSPELWAFIEGEFGGWKRGEAGPPEPAAEPALPAPGRVVLVERRGASQALLWVGVRAPTRSACDEPALDAVEWLVGSRLQQHLRVEQGVSYGVHVTRLERGRAAAVTVSAAVDREAGARSLGRVLSTLRTLGESPVSRATAAWAAWQVARDYGFRFDTVAGATDALEELALERRPADWFEKQPESIAGLDPERIQAAARSLALGREAVVVLGDREALEPQLRKAGYQVEVVAEPAER